VVLFIVLASYAENESFPISSPFCRMIPILQQSKPFTSFSWNIERQLTLPAVCFSAAMLWGTKSHVKMRHKRCHQCCEINFLSYVQFAVCRGLRLSSTTTKHRKGDNGLTPNCTRTKNAQKSESRFLTAAGKIRNKKTITTRSVVKG